MYYPILRGRQNELIAVRELSAKGKLDQVAPIIEPVKASSTLLKTMTALGECGNECFFVPNPEVGFFIREMSFSSNFADAWREVVFEKYPGKIHPCFHLRDNAALSEAGSFGESVAGIFDRNHEDVYREMVDGGYGPDPVLVEDEFRRHVRTGAKILLADRFKARPRNADYRETSDEFFSEDHKYYLEEGYAGFSDYSIVGRPFVEGGYRPRTVAIHIVYLGDNNVLNIHHAVSDTGDFQDLAGLYGSALCNLYSWMQQLSYAPDMMTEGLHSLMLSYKEGSFPGLGMVKRWSIMHHLELVNAILGG